MRTAIEIPSLSPEHTAEIGAAIGALLREGDVVALHGDLGAGKTCLVRGIATGMGLDPAQVSSPTFVIVTEYAAPAPGRPATRLGPPLVHVDAYRLSGPDDLDSVGWERVMDGSSAVVVEWAERIGAATPDHPTTRDATDAPPVLGDPAFVAHIALTPTGAQTRRLRLDAPPAWALRPGWARLLAHSRPGGDRCRICGKPIDPASATLFCSDQCRSADLGRWFSGRYAISRELTPDDEPGDAATPPA